MAQTSRPYPSRSCLLSLEWADPAWQMDLQADPIFSPLVALTEKGIAQCILLAKPDSVYPVAEAQGVSIPRSMQIIDPASVRERYIEPMVELRKHKGLTAGLAEQKLEDNVVLGTMCWHWMRWMAGSLELFTPPPVPCAQPCNSSRLRQG